MAASWTEATLPATQNQSSGRGPLHDIALCLRRLARPCPSGLELALLRLAGLGIHLAHARSLGRPLRALMPDHLQSHGFHHLRNIGFTASLAQAVDWPAPAHRSCSNQGRGKLRLSQHRHRQSFRRRQGENLRMPSFLRLGEHLGVRCCTARVKVRDRDIAVTGDLLVLMVCIGDCGQSRHRPGFEGDVRAQRPARPQRDGS